MPGQLSLERRKLRNMLEWMFRIARGGAEDIRSITSCVLGGVPLLKRISP